MQRIQYAAWGPGELMSAAAAIVTGRVVSGPGPERIAAKLRELTGVQSAWPVNAGRTAIWLALMAMHKLAPDRNRVIVPAYLCPGVADAVERAGLSLIVVDVGDELNIDSAAVRASLDETTLAVLVPHMYGCPARVGEIEQMCRAAGVFMIDDAAQVAGVEHGGRVLGGFGDAGILSFAQSKSIVTGIRGSGGVLLVSNPALEPLVRKAFEQLPGPRGRLTQFGYFLCNYITWPRLGWFGSLAGRATERLASVGAPQDWFTPARLSNLDAVIAARQFTRLAAVRVAKVRVAGLIADESCRVEGVQFPQYAPGRYLTRFMLAVPDGAGIPALRSSLRAAGVMTRPGYPALAVQGRSFANAERWSRRLIEVPGRTTMDARDAQVVCEALDRALGGRAATGVVEHRSGTAA